MGLFTSKYNIRYGYSKAINLACSLKTNGVLSILKPEGEFGVSNFLVSVTSCKGCNSLASNFYYSFWGHDAMNSQGSWCPIEREDILMPYY